MIHAYMHYLTVIQHWGAHTDKHNTISNYWFIFMLPGLIIAGVITTVFGCMSWEKHHDTTRCWAAIIRSLVGGVVIMLFWPYIYWSLLPLIALALMATVVWAFVINPMPSKAQRIARRQEKAETLRGKVSEARREMV